MKKTLILVISTMSFFLRAQQLPFFENAHLYSFVYNPAYHGLVDNSQFLVSHQQQMVGLSDAPYSQYIGFSAPLTSQKIGLGFAVSNDVAHLFYSTTAKASLSYHLQVNEIFKVSFGISLGSFIHRIRLDNITVNDPTESILASNNDKQMRFDSDAGVRVEFKRINQQPILTYRLIRNYLITGRYDYSISNNLTLVPTIVINSAQGQNPMLESVINTLVKGKYWIGLGYGIQGVIKTHMAIQLEDKLTIHYNYSRSVKSLNLVSSGNHELSLHYTFGRAGNVGGEDIERLSHENEEQYEMIDQLGDKQEKIIEKTEELDKKTEDLRNDVNNNKEEIKRLKELLNSIKEEEDKFYEKEKTTLNGVEETGIDEDLDTTLRENVHGVTHLHYYVVVGTFMTIKDAKFFNQVLKREYGLETTLVIER